MNCQWQSLPQWRSVTWNGLLVKKFHFGIWGWPVSVDQFERISSCFWWRNLFSCENAFVIVPGLGWAYLRTQTSRRKQELQFWRWLETQCMFRALAMWWVLRSWLVAVFCAGKTDSILINFVVATPEYSWMNVSCIYIWTAASNIKLNWWLIGKASRSGSKESMAMKHELQCKAIDAAIILFGAAEMSKFLWLWKRGRYVLFRKSVLQPWGHVNTRKTNPMWAFF